MTTDEIMALADDARLGYGWELRRKRAALRAAIEQLVRERDDWRETANSHARVLVEAYGGEKTLLERAERAEREIAESHREIIKEAKARERAEQERDELAALLREAKRSHKYFDTTDPESCPFVDFGERCTCGAEEWNARIDAALKEGK